MKKFLETKYFIMVMKKFLDTKYFIMAMTIIYLLICILSAVSCKKLETPNTEVSNKKESRFSVRYVQSFEDDTAPYGFRKIYIINDKVNEKEYIGIVGVGISEIISSPKASQNE